MRMCLIAGIIILILVIVIPAGTLLSQFVHTWVPLDLKPQSTNTALRSSCHSPLKDLMSGCWLRGSRYGMYGNETGFRNYESIQ